MTSKILPSEITSYDLLKAFAVIIMVVDHMGAYFFPDELWLRAIGRLCVPAWLFLIGYANSRDLSFKLCAGAGVLIVANFVVGMPIFPWNILATIIVVRLLIDPVMSFVKRGEHYLWATTALLIPLSIVTYPLCEYGTLGLLISMFGYMVRHKGEFSKDQIFAFMVSVLIAFLLVQQVDFGFSILQFSAMAVGAALVCLTLLDFKAKTYPALTKKLVFPVRWVLQFCGRKTLEIYVVHLLIFKLVALYLGIGVLEFLDWKWI